MASILDMSASSDSEDDVDYVPNGAQASDSSCDDDEVESDDELSGVLKTKEGQQKAVDKDVEGKSDSATENGNEKERANELWESFLTDVGESVIPKKSNSCNNSTNEGNNTPVISSVSEAKPEIDTKKPVSKVYEFAGETVNVCVNSCDSPAESKNLESVPKQNPPVKRGIDSVLGTILNKNKKLTVLEKSKFDWDSFKKDEGLDNELEKFNKGKMGYIERQRFLERSDLKSFEKEKSMRQILRKK